MRKLILLFLICLPFVIIGQNKDIPTFKISGKIIDASTKKPVDYATIIFKSAGSGAIKFGGITNQRGNFAIVVEEGTYNASVEFLSYKSKKINISKVTRDLNIGTLELYLDLESLQEVLVVADKIPLEIKANKLVFNVEKDIASEGSMVTDILNNIPSISVDPDGSIQLNGMDNPTVLINGKVSLLTKKDVLKSLPAGSIDKIEVLSNPGAKYQASSTGIINIILRKGVNEGFNTSVIVSGGFKDYYGGLVNLNYKNKKVNIFFNPSYFHKNVIKTAYSETEYFNNGNTSSFLNEKSEFDSKNNGFTSNLGADFYLSDKSTLSAIFNYSNIQHKSTTNTYSEIFDPAKELLGINNRFHQGKFNDEILEFSIDFKQLFKNEEQQLTASVKYSTDVEEYQNYVTNTNSGFSDEAFVEKNSIENYITDAQFTTPLNETSNMTFGYYGEFGSLPFSKITIESTERINYNEDIHAAFIDYEKSFKNLYLGIGLRGEFSQLTIDYPSLNVVQEKNYNDLFPSAFLEFTINDNQNLTVSYSRNILRPDYKRLQPFEQKYTETQTYKGNEQLEPMYIDMARLSYLVSNDGITFTPALYFNKYNNYWEDVTYRTGEEINGAQKLITTPMNVGHVDYFGGELTLTIAATKWLSFTGYANLIYFDQDGIIEFENEANETISKKYIHQSSSGSQSLLTKITIPTVFDFQFNLKNQMRSVGAYSTRKSYTYASIAISKDFKNASLSLSSNDVFNSYKTTRERFNEGFNSKSRIQNKYQTVILSFTYRFNQSKQQRNVDFYQKDINPEF